MLSPQAAAKNRPQFLVSSNNRNEFSFYSAIFLTIYANRSKRIDAKSLTTDFQIPPPLCQKIGADGGRGERFAGQSGQPAVRVS